METPIKQHFKEASITKNRALGALLFGFVCCLALITRLIYLQCVEHRFYATLSKQNVVDIIRLKPARGLIYDRNGVLLAKNIPSYTLALIPEKITDLNKIISTLTKIIPINEENILFFKRQRHQHRPFEAVPLKLNITEQEAYRIYANQYHLNGVVVQTSSQRYYPLGDLSSEILGYVASINQNERLNPTYKDYDLLDNVGKGGIERYYEKILRGTPGLEEVEMNASAHIVRVLSKQAPIAGKNIYLTIDSQLQQKAHELLGKENGSIVAIKPNTGEVLALVSHPSFDPNLFAGGISQHHYQKMLNSPDSPLYNRAIRGQFAAGSTLKPFIALASLDRGLISAKTRVYDPGWFQLPNTKHVYHDWKPDGHGWVNISKAIEMSCDTFFYTLAPQLGIKQLDDILLQFRFGQKTNIDLPGEKAGLVPSPEWKMQSQGTPWYTGDTIETIIGQGFFLVTPIQLAAATTIIANHGRYFQPHLLLKTVDEHNHEEIQPPKKLTAPIIQQQWPWKTVIKAMQAVVDGRHGSGINFGKHPDYQVAAKTGTAQIYGHSRDEYHSRNNIPKRLRNNHLFIAFAPTDHPEIAVALVVEHAAAADKKVGKLIDFYLKEKHHA